jgi:hypothetical protein
LCAFAVSVSTVNQAIIIIIYIIEAIFNRRTQYLFLVSKSSLRSNQKNCGA